jgi:hypothetical protein
MSGHPPSPEPGSGAPRRRLLGPFLAHVGAPVAASVLLHAGVGAALLAGAWHHRGGTGVGTARSEVLINLPPPPERADAREKGDRGEAARPAPPEAPLPQLQGLSNPTLASAPVLHSGVPDAIAPGELMRTETASTGATFAGLGARRAESVVYVVDASGAMVSSLKFILEELERSVRGLSSGQRFAVVLFRERTDTGAKYEQFVPPGSDGSAVKLASATALNKAALSRWLAGIRPSGKSDPLDGLRCGLAFRPDVVFLLSRSIHRSAGDAEGVWGRGKDETLAELDRLNPREGSGRRRIVIKAIQFLEEDPTGTMQAIGEGHGDGPGSYSVLGLAALGK